MSMNTVTKILVGAASMLMVIGSVSTSSAQLGGTGNNPKNIGSGVTPQGVGGAAYGSAQLFAVVNANGTRLRGKGEQSAVKLAAGNYEVRFNRNIAGCVWVGTIGHGTFSGSTSPSFISITGRAGTGNGLFVQTWNAAGTPTDLPFLVYVDC